MPRASAAGPGRFRARQGGCGRGVPKEEVAGLMYHNLPDPGALSNRSMDGASQSPTPAQRAALLRYEAAYEAWRVACVRALQAEERLWTGALQGAAPDGLAAEAARLRAEERRAYTQVMDALRDCDAG